MHPTVRAAYPADRTAVARARRFVRDTLVEWGAEDAVDDAVLLTSELATNAVTHAGTPFEVVCRADDSSVQIEVVDHAPGTLIPAPGGRTDLSVNGRGLLMPVMLAAAWGVSYAADSKTVWFRLSTAAALPARTPAVTRTVASPGAASVDTSGGGPLDVTPACADRVHQGWLSFLAEASTLLAGTLDESMLLALAAQLVVPRLARWCAFFVADDLGGVKLAHVWHADERRIDALRELLGKVEPPPVESTVRPWAGLCALPADGLREVQAGTAITVPLRARWHSLGTLVLGRAEELFPHDNLWLVEDLGNRIAAGLDNARMYSRQQAASQALQHSLLPYAVPRIPGIEHSVVYRPAGEGYDVGGDFYDVFQVGPERWRFAIGDVCGTGPEAAAVTGLARHALRLLAGEGHGVATVMARLNQAILAEEDRGRLLTLLHGELWRGPGGEVRLTLVSAGHPFPLRLSPAGEVTAVARAQMLLGAVDDVVFEEDTVDLDPGDVLLCVTDGVTERRAGCRLLDDDDGLARFLGGWTGLSAGAVAERLRQTVEAFAPEPGSDDLAILVLRVL